MRDERPRCGCGKYVGYRADSYTPYGCADPEAPEPYDPEYLCHTCAFRAYKEWVRRFNEGYRSGDWMKSRAEMRAAKACGLRWVGSNGVGVLGTLRWASSHQYIDQSRYEELAALPYWGWCGACGSENKNGYCGNNDCEKSFANKVSAKLSTG